jgi:hypothetical protein
LGPVGRIIIGIVLIFVAVVMVVNRLEGSKTYTVTGVVIIQGADHFYAQDGRCIGDGGFQDIAFGTKVTIRNEKNELIASGDLEFGTAGSTICRHEFVIKNVPSAEFYQFGVSHRSAPTFTKEQMESSNWAVSFSLGG